MSISEFLSLRLQGDGRLDGIGLKICKEVKVAGEQMHPKYITVISLRFPWNSNSLLDLPLPVGSVGSETSSMFLFQRTNQVWVSALMLVIHIDLSLPVGSVAPCFFTEVTGISVLL